LFLLFCLLIGTAYAYDVSNCSDNNNWQSIGNCILEGSFAGDYLLFALIMTMLLMIFMWQTNMPAGAAIGISLIMFFALSGFLGANLYGMLFNLSLLVIGAMVGLAILHYVRR
jgi:hypothetical protein